jgi:hypothetical protein
MKKIFLLATFLVVGVASAQEVPTITDAQLEQSKRIATAQKTIETHVNEKVAVIMRENNLDTSLKHALTELVMEKESLLVRLNRETLDAATKKARSEEINNSYKLKLNAFIENH